jgi:hypothetical protein
MQTSSIAMENIISFDKEAGFLHNPPTVVPCPDFSKLCALCQHIIEALKQLECPQSYIHSRLSLTMAPNVYTLLEPNPFVVPGNPGPASMYTQFAPPAAIKMINATLKQDNNYFLSYKNIN